MKKKTKPASEPQKHVPYRLEVESFEKMSHWEVRTLNEPSCFNGMVRVRRYRITVEEIEEPDSVLIARLQELWDRSDNHHDYAPLTAAAKELGYTFPNLRGTKRRPR